MRFSLAVASALVAGVYAADHVVTVGENGVSGESYLDRAPHTHTVFRPLLSTPQS